MTLKNSVRNVLVLGAIALAAGSCSRQSPTEVWPPIIDPVVFSDTFGSKVIFQAFAGSKLDAVAIDSTVSHTGAASLKITVPNPGDPTGGYAGGAFTTSRARDLTGYNALSFWVKASRAVNLETAGLGNDNTGTSKFEAKRTSVPMTTAWTQVLIPIPNAAKLTAEGGMFFFGEGPQGGTGLTIWIDDIRFLNTALVTNPRPALTPQTINTIAGATVDLSGSTKTVFAVGGLDQTVTHMPGYFDFTSSDSTIGSVVYSILHVLAAGTTTLTAKLGAVSASGAISVVASTPPAVAAPAPTVPASDVISLFSSAYTNVPVDTWSATWDLADVSDVLVAGHPTKLYTNLTYAGIEFTTHLIDASTMTTFHMDVFVPSGVLIKVKLVDFGANGIYGPVGSGNDDTQSELTFSAAASTPTLVVGSWYSLEIPLASFTTLTNRAHLAQLILSGDVATSTRTVYVDNIYLHK